MQRQQREQAAAHAAAQQRVRASGGSASRRGGSARAGSGKTREWAAANHRQVPLKKHSKGYSGNGVRGYAYLCCECTDQSSTYGGYCCSPSSPTHRYIKKGYTYNGSGSQTDSRSYTSAEETAKKVMQAAIADVGPDAWAAANHRQVPLKKHDGRWVRAARSRAALTPRRRCTRFARRRSPSSLAPLFFPFRRVLRHAPAL